MIYHLFQLLKDYDIPGQGLMSYLSFRAMLASVTAMLISFFAGRRIIRWLQKKQIGETIRDLGLEGQMQKKGTPTMGGVIIILAITVPVLLFCDLTNIYTQLLLFTTLWCGGIGFADDYIKVFKHNKEGMSERGKLILQILLGFIVGLTVCFNNDIVVREKVNVAEASNGTTYLPQGSSDLDVDSETIVSSSGWKMENIVKSTKTTIPFVKNHEFDYKWLSPFQGAWGWYCKWAIYVLMIVIVITACSNGTNLTDGMDGLAAGSSAIVGIVIGIIAWLSGGVDVQLRQLEDKILHHVPGVDARVDVPGGHKEQIVRRTDEELLVARGAFQCRLRVLIQHDQLRGDLRNKAGAGLFIVGAKLGECLVRHLLSAKGANGSAILNHSAVIHSSVSPILMSLVFL